MNKKYDTNSFIEKANRIHNNFYDYSKTEYVSFKKNVMVTCPIHGDFTIKPSKHLIGQGCPKCRYIKSSNSKRRKLENVIQKCKEVHGDKYDYSLIKEYKNDREKLPISCPIHGVFYQTMNNHIIGKQGCPECGNIKCHNSRIMTTEEFIEKANKVHNNFYNYSKTTYINSMENVIVTCPIHGDFEQIPRNHLFGSGCPKCFKEKSHVENDVLNYIKEICDCEVIENDRTILDGKEIDILIPSKNIGFEINGLIWHSEKFQTNKMFHVEKKENALKKGINLIHIYEDDWILKQNIIKSRIKNLLHLNEIKIYARKCKIKNVPYKNSKLFLDENHLQGNCISKYRYGLYYNNELISLMTFGNLRKNVGKSSNYNEYEMLRFCNKLNTNIIGGASKLLKHFINDINPDRIISYADRNWSNGNLYNTLGFKLYNISSPSYYYVINKKKVNRFNLRKDILISKFNCPKNITEHEFCLSKQWYRIYDCGCLCYEINLKKII